MKMLKISRLSWIFIVISVSLHAQEIKRFRHITVNEGLAHTDATCFCQDTKGFIWIGTNSGLQRFDGQQLKLFSNTISVLDQVYNDRITSLASDSDLIWVGTENGLQLFDLTTETYVHLNESSELKSDSRRPIRDLTVFGDYCFFIQDNTLLTARYSKSNKTVYISDFLSEVEQLPGGFSNALVLSVTHDSAKHIWIGTNHGLIGVKLVKEKFRFNDFWGNEKDELKLLNYPSLVSFKNGRLWVLSTGQLFVYSVNDQTGKYHSLLKKIGVNEMVRERLKRQDPAEISDILIDGHDNFWMGASDGLFHIGNPLASDIQIHVYTASYTEPFSLGASHISSLFEDRTNCLWIGTWGGGVSWSDLGRKKFELIAPNYIDDKINLDNTFVRALVVDSNGNIWMGTRNKGINIYNPRTGKYSNIFKNKNVNSELTSQEIRSLYLDDDKIYIGTVDGLNILDLKSGAIQKIRSSATDRDGFISSTAIFNIVKDKRENIWLATWGSGINKLVPDNSGSFVVKRYDSSPNSPVVLTSDKVNSLFYDKDKNELLATTNKGLNRFILDDKCEIEELVCYRGYEGEGSFNSEYLWPIAKENDSVYWIGTLGGGLSRVTFEKGKNFNNQGKYHAENFTRLDGAPGNDIESLLRDDDGYLWIGGKGLSRFDPNTKEFWNFDVNDGLQSDGFKIGSAYKSKSGYLYFGGINGANYFNPSEITRNTIPSQVAITSLRIHNASVEFDPLDSVHSILKQALTHTDRIVLNYTENNFSISFASLHFANPQKCKYKYILDGYDKDWHYISNDYPVANYSNLAYGTYVFKVDATNNDGIWTDDPRVLTFTIIPPWWRSNLAYGVYFVLFILTSFLIYYNLSRWIKMRNELKAVEAEEARKEEIHQTKLQFFTNISHEFKTPLTLIMTPLEQLMDGNVTEEDKPKLLKTMSDNASRLNNLVKELMDFRKAETGKEKVLASTFVFVDFAQRIIEQFKSEIQHKAIKFSVDELNCGHIAICSDQGKVSKVIFNLVSNALKFVDAGGQISIRMFLGSKEQLNPLYEHTYAIYADYHADEYLILQVADSGIGISSESINQIFDRFFHFKSQENNHLGSGIGLAYVKSLMLILKGFIIVSSERSVGTEFLVGFPLGKGHLSAEEMTIEVSDVDGPIGQIVSDMTSDGGNSIDQNQVVIIDEDEASGKMVMLVVEDNSDLRNVLNNQFKKHYQVLEAENGKEALDVLSKRTPDIIISDIMMPQMDGLELCKRIREDINMSHIPLVLLTAKSSVENQVEGFETGADLYIPKPFSIKLLELQVSKLIETRVQLKKKYAADIFADNRDIAQNFKDKAFLDKFIGFVDKHMSEEDLDVDHLCRELNIGRTNLYKKIKSLSGMPMGAFIRSLKLKKAARILKNEDITISEVLFRIGISSNSYFTKSFKEQFGVTPSEFINQK